MNKRESDAIGIVLHLLGQMVVVSVTGMRSILMQRPNPTFSVGGDGQQTGGVQDDCRREYIVFQYITLRKEY